MVNENLELNNRIYQKSKISCIINFLIILSIYLVFLILDTILSLKAVSSNLTGDNLLVSVLFTLIIIIAPQCVFNGYLFLSKDSKSNFLITIFCILGIFFATCFSLVSIWGTYETLYKITFSNIITNDKKDNYQKELSEYKQKELSLLNSISKTRDKILELPADYFKIRTQYENLLKYFNKELELLELKKPKLIDNNTNTKDLSIVESFKDLGISINVKNFLSIILILSSFGLEVVFTIISYFLFITFDNLRNFNSFSNNTNTNNLEYINTKNIEFILDCLENDGFTIKSINNIANQKNIKINKVLNIIKYLKKNGIIVKNKSRFILNASIIKKIMDNKTKSNSIGFNQKTLLN